ncbi:MAG: hypothetical protein PHS97_07730 [Oscillospiraceae bacterium]|nr:hypothetical protein [Oscillospiraceae bacterium]
MIQDCEMLNSIRNGTQMGKSGIETVMKNAADGSFSMALQGQLAEYTQIQQKADELLNTLGGKEKNISPMVLSCAKMGAKMKLMKNGTTSKIAEMMIEGNTKGMIKSLQTQRDFSGHDSRVSTLSQKLLDTELHNIEQMKAYL